MILIHESLPREASLVGGALGAVLGIRCEFRDERRDDLLVPISHPSWPGCHASGVMDRLASKFRGRAVLLLTQNDLFDYGPDRSPDDVWMFGLTRSWESHSLISTARLRGTDSSPSPTVRVPDDQYQRRLETLSVHEIGHVLTQLADHHRDAAWVNASTDARDELGRHCDDPTCVMYPTVDVKAPRLEQGWMEFQGAESRRVDAGLDDQIARLRPGWFCERCRSAIRVPDAYGAGR